MQKLKEMSLNALYARLIFDYADSKEYVQDRVITTIDYLTGLHYNRVEDCLDYMISLYKDKTEEFSNLENVLYLKLGKNSLFTSASDSFYWEIRRDYMDNNKYSSRGIRPEIITSSVLERYLNKHYNIEEFSKDSAARKFIDAKKEYVEDCLNDKYLKIRYELHNSMIETILDVDLNNINDPKTLIRLANIRSYLNKIESSGDSLSCLSEVYQEKIKEFQISDKLLDIYDINKINSLVKSVSRFDNYGRDMPIVIKSEQQVRDEFIKEYYGDDNIEEHIAYHKEENDLFFDQYFAQHCELVSKSNSAVQVKE